jgi:hypothetical protein
MAKAIVQYASTMAQEDVEKGVTAVGSEASDVPVGKEPGYVYAPLKMMNSVSEAEHLGLGDLVEITDFRA